PAPPTSAHRSSFRERVGSVPHPPRNRTGSSVQEQLRSKELECKGLRAALEREHVLERERDELRQAMQIELEREQERQRRIEQERDELRQAMQSELERERERQRLIEQELDEVRRAIENERVMSATIQNLPEEERVSRLHEARRECDELRIKAAHMERV